MLDDKDYLKLLADFQEKWFIKMSYADDEFTYKEFKKEKDREYKRLRKLLPHSLKSR